MIAACWAQSTGGVIGINGKIPWTYPGDLRRFKRLTIGCVVIMGRKTYESIGKPLPGRENVVISNTIDELDGCRIRRTVGSAVREFERERDIWLIGGSQVYREAMVYADFIDQVIVPWSYMLNGSEEVATAPRIDPTIFNPGPVLRHPDEGELSMRTWVRRGKIDFVDVERWYASRYVDASNELCRQQGSMSR